MHDLIIVKQLKKKSKQRSMMQRQDYKKKGRVCVTGGTGFLGSWMVKKLLELGYSVNTTTRMEPGSFNMQASLAIPLQLMFHILNH